MESTNNTQIPQDFTNPIQKVKVAVYARVSLEENDDKEHRYQEPRNQVDPLLEWAKSMNWEVVNVFIDRGSRANPARPQWMQMMADAMQRKFQVILVWKLDRFSREGISQVFAYIQKLRGRGVALRSMSESWIDTSAENPLTEVVMAVMAWAASWERENISKRTKLGIQRRKNLGIYKGGRPAGAKDKKPRRLRSLKVQYA